MKKVLICALDWGLGHATRIIPVIRELKRQRADIHIGSSGPALALLKIEFPEETFIELPAYRPYYSHNAMMWSMFRQFPKFIRAIRDEHALIERYVTLHSIDIIISDNRYGCWSASTVSVLITHQTQMLMPDGYSWLSSWVNRRLSQWNSRFSQIWIPDQQGSGLTDPFIKGWHGSVIYIGWLSRFEATEIGEMKYDLIALVSGPEPQRSVLEELLTRELEHSGLKSLMVTGQPEKSIRQQEGGIEKISHLPSIELAAAIVKSKMVISRSGYSTVMDLITLGKQAIFIPTPQQPEQLFLARFLMEKGIALGMDQERFSLPEALEKSKTFKGLNEMKIQQGLLTHAVSALLYN